MLLTFVALASALSASPAIRLEPAGAAWVVRAIDAGNATLSVDVDGSDADSPAMLGSVVSDGNDRVFTPRFPFQSGVRYRAALSDGVTITFEIPAKHSAGRAAVAHVYPTVEVLPENQLKFYIEFATPMTRGAVYRHVQLLDAQGNAIELPFLELDEELWDATLQRFTLYFDPGRVKSDLVPNREVGSPLRAGERYTFVVKAGWKDANGQPLASDYRKTFSVGPRDAASPDPTRWKVAAPRGSTREPLEIAFTEPMEAALAARMIEVVDAVGRSVDGTVVVSDSERRWRFTPEDPWRAGQHQLVIDTALEDLAGNRINRPFEVLRVRTNEERQADVAEMRVPVIITE